MSSSTARAVNVRQTRQFDASNDSVAVSGVASASTSTAGSGLVTATDTAPVGRRFAKRTVHEPSAAAPPPSDSASDVGASSMVATSSSSTVTATGGRADAASPVYSAAPVTVCVTTAVSSAPSSSSTARTRTARQRDQSEAVNDRLPWSPSTAALASTATFADDAATATVTAALGCVFRRSR